MTRFFVALAVVAATASSVAAQAPGAELPLPAFLEKRVPEELASEGHVLSRDNLTLKVEAAGTIFVVSLVDLTTGRVAASTKIDQLPADREAAVASVTHVAADLVTQISGREAPPPPPPPVIVDDRAERAAREVANLKFQKESIRFGATYDLYVSNTSAVLTRNWTAYRGATDQELEPAEFYRLVGHNELANEYEHRRKVAIGGIVAGAALMLGGTVYLFANLGDNCQTSDPNFETCIDNHSNTLNDVALATTVLALVGGAAVFVGAYYYRHPHPVSENDAKNMAEEFNNGLRQNLGLPVVERHWLHDVHIAPYMTHGEGGLALGARF